MDEERHKPARILALLVEVKSAFLDIEGGKEESVEKVCIFVSDLLCKELGPIAERASYVKQPLSVVRTALR